MRRQEKVWNPKFVEYMDFIVNNENYHGLAIAKKEDGSWGWVATGKSRIGRERTEWAKEKAKELGIPEGPGMYAQVMRAIHPTGKKVCQICGREMSIFYHYPSANLVKAIKKEFGCEYSEIDHIGDIWDDLKQHGFSDAEIAEFLIKKGRLELDCTTAAKDEVISLLEEECRTKGKKLLCPGAMSNFPDRFDGFHSYNRCCRSTQDKGRSKENLRSYLKDRRAYEYWSDGNIHAANQFMGSKFFRGTSADHIGPISLGFVHDPRYLQPMATSDNSSKRDRLSLDDVEKIIQTEERTGVSPISWQSRRIWEYIRNNYKLHPELIGTKYRDALKQNMNNYMYTFYEILQRCPANGKEFLIESFLKPHFKDFEYSYSFDEKGSIITKTPRHYTERNTDEFERYTRVAIDALYDYNKKDNRNTIVDLSSAERRELEEICYDIEAQTTSKEELTRKLMAYIEKIEERLIREI